MARESEALPPDRRPIASRDLALSRSASRWLARRGASPNSISVLGMIAGIGAGGSLVLTAEAPESARLAWLAAAVLVQARLAANMLDGMVAVETGRASPVGELFNEIPDRVSDAAILVGLGYAAGGSPVLGWALALAAVFTAYVRASARAAGAPQDFCGPFAKPQRMFVVTLLAVVGAISPATMEAGIPAWVTLLLLAGTLATALRRLLRAGRALRR